MPVSRAAMHQGNDDEPRDHVHGEIGRSHGRLLLSPQAVAAAAMAHPATTIFHFINSRLCIRRVSGA
jgi:hypothetical protein